MTPHSEACTHVHTHVHTRVRGYSSSSCVCCTLFFFSCAQKRATAAVAAARDRYGVAAVDLSSTSGTPNGSHRKRRSRFSTVANIADSSPGGAATGRDGRGCLDVISQSPSPAAVSTAGSSPRSPVSVGGAGPRQVLELNV